MISVLKKFYGCAGASLTVRSTETLRFLSQAARLGPHFSRARPKLSRRIRSATTWSKLND